MAGELQRSRNDQKCPGQPRQYCGDRFSLWVDPGIEDGEAAIDHSHPQCECSLPEREEFIRQSVQSPEVSDGGCQDQEEVACHGFLLTHNVLHDADQGKQAEECGQE